VEQIDKPTTRLLQIEGLHLCWTFTQLHQMITNFHPKEDKVVRRRTDEHFKTRRGAYITEIGRRHCGVGISPDADLEAKSKNSTAFASILTRRYSNAQIIQSILKLLKF